MDVQVNAAILQACMQLLHSHCRHCSCILSVLTSIACCCGLSSCRCWRCHHCCCRCSRRLALLPVRRDLTHPASCQAEVHINVAVCRVDSYSVLRQVALLAVCGTYVGGRGPLHATGQAGGQTSRQQHGITHSLGCAQACAVVPSLSCVAACALCCWLPHKCASCACNVSTGTCCLLAGRIPATHCGYSTMGIVESAWRIAENCERPKAPALP